MGLEFWWQFWFGSWSWISHFDLILYENNFCWVFRLVGFFPGLGTILVSLYVCMFSSTITFMFRCIDDDGDVFSFYVIAYFNV